MPRRNQPTLPPPVAAHVQQQLLRYDWDTKAKELTHLCDGCPADRNADICAYCPLEGVALGAATVALQSRIAKQQAAAKRRAALADIAKDI